TENYCCLTHRRCLVRRVLPPGRRVRGRGRRALFSSLSSPLTIPIIGTPGGAVNFKGLRAGQKLFKAPRKPLPRGHRPSLELETAYGCGLETHPEQGSNVELCLGPVELLGLSKDGRRARHEARAAILKGFARDPVSPDLPGQAQYLRFIIARQGAIDGEVKAVVNGRQVMERL